MLLQVEDAWRTAITEFLEPIKWKHLKRSDEMIKHPAEYKWYKRDFKISRRWVRYAKEKWYHNDIISWLKEIYVRRWHIPDLRILNAVIAHIYFNKELFIYFQPRQFELWICDREHLNLEFSWMYMVADFWKMIDRIFCNQCTEEFLKSSSIKDIGFKNWLSKKQQIDALRMMFNWLYEMASNEHFDDVSLTMEWVINDPNRFHEIEWKIEYWEVWFIKQKSKVWIKVKTKKTLKDTKKYLKKK
jgi:hypothetical protein